MRQGSLDLSPTFDATDYEYGLRTSGEVHGVVLTQRHIVELMLDLAGYTIERDLATRRVMEPACGTGAFVVPIVERLMLSARKHGRSPDELTDSVVAVDIDPKHVESTRRNVVVALVASGIDLIQAQSLAKKWVVRDDALIMVTGGSYDVVIGNPPYVRTEQLSPRLQLEYRSRYETLFDRADLYVAFIERGLQLLSDRGTLCFICADRWTLNRYGAPLRALISRDWKVRYYIDLHKTSPFESDVSAYPSIFGISRGNGGSTFKATLDAASVQECLAVSRAWSGVSENDSSLAIDRYEKWFDGESPWVLSSPRLLSQLRDLEARFQPIESDGKTRVGIGVATGCDKAFIVDRSSEIEADRLLPLVMRKDIVSGRIQPQGRFVINTFCDTGSVVDLEQYPGLAAHLCKWEVPIRGRHVAKKNKASWFRTIDRVFPELVSRPKLLIPDIAGAAEVTYDEGHFYPHHNLYFVTSSNWDLEVLGALLTSRVALFFVWSYAVRMRGGYLRFQAQYLRRIRLPDPADLDSRLCGDLKRAFRSRDFGKIDECAYQAYELDEPLDFDFLDNRQ